MFPLQSSLGWWRRDSGGREESNDGPIPTFKCPPCTFSHCVSAGTVPKPVSAIPECGASRCMQALCRLISSCIGSQGWLHWFTDKLILHANFHFFYSSHSKSRFMQGKEGMGLWNEIKQPNVNLKLCQVPDKYKNKKTPEYLWIELWANRCTDITVEFQNMRPNVETCLNLKGIIFSRFF